MVVATHSEATKHPCQGIAFGDSLRSGDMSDREAEFEIGICNFCARPLATFATRKLLASLVGGPDRAPSCDFRYAKAPRVARRGT